MKRTPMPPRQTPLQRRRRASILAAFHAATTAPRRRKTAGEFTPKQRKLMYGRWDGRCVVCGDWMHPGMFDCQHRVARGSGGSRDPRKAHVTNGIAVHRPCHQWIEDNPTQARDLYGYRVDQGQHPRDWPVKTWAGTWVVLTDDGGHRPAQLGGAS